MSGEIVKSEPGTSLAEFVAQAVKDPNIDVTKLEALLRMQREIIADNARVDFNLAMNAAQAEIQPVARKTENTQTKSFYAKLEAVDEAIRPIYLAHGFALSYDAVEPLNPGQIRMQCQCTHVGGHREIYHREAAADTLGPKGTPVKTALHGGASTETFLKRYLACGIFNVVFKDQDDDGVRGGYRPIDDASVKQLHALAKEANANIDAFCRYMGVDTLEEIPAEKYGEAINALMARRRLKERTCKEHGVVDCARHPADPQPARSPAAPKAAGAHAAGPSPEGPLREGASPIPPPPSDPNDKLAYQVWWAGAFLNRVREAKTNEEFLSFLTANGEAVQGYYATLTPAGAIAARKELDDIGKGLIDKSERGE